MTAACFGNRSAVRSPEGAEGCTSNKFSLHYHTVLTRGRHGLATRDNHIYRMVAVDTPAFRQVVGPSSQLRVHTSSSTFTSSSKHMSSTETLRISVHTLLVPSANWLSTERIIVDHPGCSRGVRSPWGAFVHSTSPKTFYHRTHLRERSSQTFGSIL